MGLKFTWSEDGTDAEKQPLTKETAGPLKEPRSFKGDWHSICGDGSAQDVAACCLAWQVPFIAWGWNLQRGLGRSWWKEAAKFFLLTVGVFVVLRGATTALVWSKCHMRLDDPLMLGGPLGPRGALLPAGPGPMGAATPMLVDYAPTMVGDVAVQPLRGQAADPAPVASSDPQPAATEPAVTTQDPDVAQQPVDAATTVAMTPLTQALPQALPDGDKDEEDDEEDDKDEEAKLLADHHEDHPEGHDDEDDDDDDDVKDDDEHHEGHHEDHHDGEGEEHHHHHHHHHHHKDHKLSSKKPSSKKPSSSKKDSSKKPSSKKAGSKKPCSMKHKHGDASMGTFTPVVGPSGEVVFRTQSGKVMDYDEALEEAMEECMEKIGDWLLLLCSVGLASLVAVVYMAARSRQQLRQRFGIEGSFAKDVWLWLCCTPCALAQETRTLMHNNVEDGLWHGPHAAPIQQQVV